MGFHELESPATLSDVCCMPLRVLQTWTNLTTLTFDGEPSMYEAIMAGGVALC